MSRAATIRAALLSATLLGLASCGSAPLRPTLGSDTVPRGEADRTSGAEIVDEPAAPPVIELLDAGAEPRTVLRYRPVAGTAKVEVVTEMSIIQQRGEVPTFQLDLPTIRQVLELRIDEADGERIAFTVTLDEASVADDAPVPAATRRDLDARLAALTGSSASGSATTAGVLDELRWSGPTAGDAGTDDPALATLRALEAGLPALIAPLPDAPVGPGARWRATSSLDVGGADTRIATTFDFKGLLGTAFAYTSASETTATDRTVEDAGITTSVSDDRAVVLTGGTADLTTLVGEASTTAEAHQHIEIDQGDGRRATDQTIRTTVTVRPLGPRS